jgi:hypothetical protein
LTLSLLKQTQFWIKFTISLTVSILTMAKIRLSCKANN